MARNRVMSLSREQRFMSCELLVDGADFEAVRQMLAAAGVAEAELPSDVSLRKYMELEEYQSHYQDRTRMLRRQHWEVEAPDPTVDRVAPNMALLLQELHQNLVVESVDISTILKLMGAMNQGRSLDLRERSAALKERQLEQEQKEEEKRQLYAFEMEDRRKRAAAAAAAVAQVDAETLMAASDEADEAPPTQQSSVNMSKCEQKSRSPVFANTPSADKRAAARKKRKKRR